MQKVTPNQSPPQEWEFLPPNGPRSRDTGRNGVDGPVLASPVPGETWARIDDSLIRGLRGLRGGSSVARLLAKHRKVRNPKALPRLTEKQIVTWADAYFARYGKYPSENAGPVEEAPGEVWINLTSALREGTRGLRGGSSLFKLLVKHGRVPSPRR